MPRAPRRPSDAPARPRARSRTGPTPAPPAAPPAATWCASRSASRATASSRPASTPRAAAPPRPRAARWSSSSRARRSSTPPLEHRRRRARSWAGCSRRSGTRPSWRPTRCTARSAPPRARAAPRAGAEPAPHARGDERRRGQRRRGAARARRRRRGGGRDARAVGRPRHRRRAQLLLPAGRDSARATSRTRMGIPHLTLDLRERFRAEVVDDFLDGYAAGRTPNPCVRCNGEVRFDAMLELADALGAARLATGHYARIARDEHGPARARGRRSRARTRATCSPSSTPRCSTGSASRSAGSRRTPSARSRATPGCRWPTSARARTSASSPASAAARSFSATAARACARPARSWTGEGRVLGRHEGQHNFTVGQRRGLGVATPGAASTCSEKDATTQPRGGRPAARNSPRGR